MANKPSFDVLFIINIMFVTNIRLSLLNFQKTNFENFDISHVLSFSFKIIDQLNYK